MNADALDPGAVIALTLALAVLALALAIARARSVLAIALLLAVLGAALAAALLALDAPGPALIEALIGAAFIPLGVLGAMLLTSPTVAGAKATIRPGALVGALVVAIGLLWAATDLPAFGGGGEGIGGVYVNSARYEIGALNAVAVVAGDYRAIDSLAVLAGLVAAALGAHALLGHGERAERAKPKQEA